VGARPRSRQVPRHAIINGRYDRVVPLANAEYHTPAAVGAEPENPPLNTLGLHRVMLAVDDIDDAVARLRATAPNSSGEVAQLRERLRLCYLRGPAGIIVALAEQIG
jgi:hypothetical protein